MIFPDLSSLFRIPWLFPTGKCIPMFPVQVGTLIKRIPLKRLNLYWRVYLIYSLFTGPSVYSYSLVGLVHTGQRLKKFFSEVLPSLPAERSLKLYLHFRSNCQLTCLSTPGFHGNKWCLLALWSENVMNEFLALSVPQSALALTQSNVSSRTLFCQIWQYCVN